MYIITDKRAATCMANLNKKITILFVEDDRTVLSVGTLMIQRFGYKVLQATSGTEAIQIFQNYIDEIGLVILNEKLPDGLGSDTCKGLKALKSDVKFLHTSGLGKIQGGNSLECGCEAFLLKPFRMEEFAHKLKEIL